MTDMQNITRLAEHAQALKVDTTDSALARAFAERHKADLQFVAAWGRWLRFDGILWAHDQTRHAFDLVHEFVAEIADKSMRSAKKINAVYGLAQADRRLAATVDQWDQDDAAVNTQGAVICLRTGDQRSASAIDYMTKTTAVAPGADCPLWLAFLDRVTNGDTSLQDYLQRVCGYCLTGQTFEHVLFFLYGTGANGKTVFINTIAGIMGEYSVTAPVDLFVQTRTEQHPTGLAYLRGSRLVVATETDGGERWSEAKIKRLTGGDKIAARFMRGDFFEYTPKFKIMIAGNHVPSLRHVDEAMRRRIHLIPFTVTIPPDERDDHLAIKLMREWPGILAWMVEGCLEWREQGLRPPEIVTKTTQEYLESEDILGDWLAEMLEASSYGFEATEDLYRSFKTFCENAGEKAPTQNRFTRQLKERGLEPDRDNSPARRRGFKNVRLNRPNVTDEARFAY